LGETPRKSRTRGSAIVISRSRNSHMRSPRSVTIAPTGIPCRSLNCAIDLVARRTTAFWPVMRPSSSAPTSAIFALAVASPSPMLTTIF
jgi:hypothetical protein